MTSKAALSHKITFVFKTGYLLASQSVPAKKPDMPSKKSGAVGIVEVGAVKNQNNLMCSHESGNTFL